MKTPFTFLMLIATLFVGPLEAQLHLEMSQGYSSIFSNAPMITETYPTNDIVIQESGEAFPMQFFAGFQVNDYLSLGAVVGYYNMREEQFDGEGIYRYQGSQEIKAWLYGLGLRFGKMHASRWYLGAGLNVGLMSLDRSRELAVYDPNAWYFNQQTQTVVPYISLMLEERFYIKEGFYLNLRPEIARVESTFDSEANLTSTTGYITNPSSYQIISLSHFSLHFGIGIIL